MRCELVECVATAAAVLPDGIVARPRIGHSFGVTAVGNDRHRVAGLGGAAATGYEQYAYSPYGMIPASYAAQLTAQSVAASQHGVGSTDNGARVQ
uniref:Uncharacterized protein n=1 Tax=Plectus sambesii TaxID=2011161 RepID=A0A914UN99_9BILA